MGCRRQRGQKSELERTFMQLLEGRSAQKDTREWKLSWSNLCTKGRGQEPRGEWERKATRETLRSGRVPEGVQRPSKGSHPRKGVRGNAHAPDDLFLQTLECTRSSPVRFCTAEYALKPEIVKREAECFREFEESKSTSQNENSKPCPQFQQLGGFEQSCTRRNSHKVETSWRIRLNLG